MKVQTKLPGGGRPIMPVPLQTSGVWVISPRRLYQQPNLVVSHPSSVVRKRGQPGSYPAGGRQYCPASHPAGFLPLQLPVLVAAMQSLPAQQNHGPSAQASHAKQGGGARLHVSRADNSPRLRHPVSPPA